MKKVHYKHGEYDAESGERDAIGSSFRWSSGNFKTLNRTGILMNNHPSFYGRKKNIMWPLKDKLSMNDPIEKKDRHNRLYTEEKARKKAIRQVGKKKRRDFLSIILFSGAAAFIISSLFTIFFNNYSFPVFVNTFLLEFLVTSGTIVINDTIYTPTINAIVEDFNLNNRQIQIAFLPIIVIWLILMVFIGFWIGSETISHNGAFIWSFYSVFKP